MGPVTIEKSFVDSSRRTAAIGGAVVAGALLVMFLLEGFGIWRPLGQSWAWGVAVIPALIWTLRFWLTARYRVAVDAEGITREHGKHRSQVAWPQVTELVELPTRQQHLAVLSSQAPVLRIPGEPSLLRAFRLPHEGVVVQADDQLRAAIIEHAGRRPRTVREVVGP